MKSLLGRMWKEEDGVLTFEWVLLVTLLTIGVVSGIAGARDAIMFAHAAERAYRSLEVEKRELQLERVRCPHCDQLSLTANPTRNAGSNVFENDPT